MYILVYLLLGAVFACLVTVTMQLCGVCDIPPMKKAGISTLKKYREEQKETGEEADCEPSAETAEAISPLYGETATALIALACFVLSFALFMVLNHYVFSSPRLINEYFNFAKLSYVLLIIAAAAIVDFRKKIIPNFLVVTGLLLRVSVLIGEAVFCRDILKKIVINDLIGLAMGFGILLLAAIITRGGVGLGDVKLFSVIGLSTGYLCTFGTLFWSLLASSIIGIVLLIKYKDKKRAFPFAPFILIGYTGVLIFGIF